jgi:hypothetical protein
VGCATGPWCFQSLVGSRLGAGRRLGPVSTLLTLPVPLARLRRSDLRRRRDGNAAHPRGVPAAPCHDPDQVVAPNERSARGSRPRAAHEGPLNGGASPRSSRVGASAPKVGSRRTCLQSLATFIGPNGVAEGPPPSPGPTTWTRRSCRGGGAGVGDRGAVGPPNERPAAVRASDYRRSEELAPVAVIRGQVARLARVAEGAPNGLRSRLLP